MKSVNTKEESTVRCGIVLAGGDGTRLRPFIHLLRGTTLPKQYVNFIGARSMLEQTFHRAERLIPPERLFTVISLNHLKYREAAKQLLGRPKGTLILQPENKGTGPGILLPLMHVYRRYPESIVVIFPSDHFILEEVPFMGHVELACRAVERDPSQLVLLGVEPHDLEPEYGYILPDQEGVHLGPSVIRKVLCFTEKPDPHVVCELDQRGALWNTLVMAFKASTLLELFSKVMPSLYYSFEGILKALGTSQEIEVVEEAYGEMQHVNFSSEILEAVSLHYPSHLGVLPVRGVYWNDWGTELQILRTLRDVGYLNRLTSTPTA